MSDSMSLPNPAKNDQTDSPSWTKYPKYALAVVSIGPSVIAPFFYLVLRIFNVSALGSTQIAFGENALAYMILLSLGLALANWLPFMALSLVCKIKMQRKRVTARSVRIAMWFSMVAMFIPNSVLFYAGPIGIISDEPGIGEGIGLGIGVVVLFPVPILGLLGWFAGRFVAWCTERRFSTDVART